MKLERSIFHVPLNLVVLLFAQQSLPFALDFAPGNGLDLARPQLIHAARDLLLPNGFGVLIYGLI